MKLIYILSGVLICCCSFSNCDKDESFNCVDFKDEIISLDPDPIQAKNYINALLRILFPDPTSEDPTGHEQNLNLFANRLAEHCGVEVTIGCYECIETLPAQSHVLVKLDSAGVIVSRTLDISTPGDEVMTLLGIHN